MEFLLRACCGKNQSAQKSDAEFSLRDPQINEDTECHEEGDCSPVESHVSDLTQREQLKSLDIETCMLSRPSILYGQHDTWARPPPKAEEISAGASENMSIGVAAAIAKAEEALKVEGFLAAEAALYEAATEFQSSGDDGALRKLRSSLLYKRILQKIQLFEREAGHALTSLEGWEAVTEFRVNYKAPGLDGVWQDVIGQDGDRCQIFSKIDGCVLNIKVLSEFPAKHPASGRPYLFSYIGMWDELDLWHTWHPIVVGNGPAEVNPRTRDELLHELCWKLTFPPLKEAEIAEVNSFFWKEEAIFFQVSQMLGDTDERTKMKPPKGFHRKVDPGVVRNLVINQGTSNAVVVMISLELKITPPAWLVKLLVRWLVPTIAQNMFDIGLPAISKGQYVERFEKDTYGLYKTLLEVSDAGPQCEARRKHKYRPGLSSTMSGFPGIDLIHNRKNSLVSFEKQLKLSSNNAPVP